MTGSGRSRVLKGCHSAVGRLNAGSVAASCRSASVARFDVTPTIRAAVLGVSLCAAGSRPGNPVAHDDQRSRDAADDEKPVMRNSEQRRRASSDELPSHWSELRPQRHWSRHEQQQAERKDRHRARRDAKGRYTRVRVTGPQAGQRIWDRCAKGDGPARAGRQRPAPVRRRPCSRRRRQWTGRGRMAARWRMTIFERISRALLRASWPGLPQ